VRINEIMNKSKIEKVQGNNVTIDHGDGTKTVVDKKKNPNALTKDDKGNVKLNQKPDNKKQNTASVIKPGAKVAIDAN
jgi:hypothetical protein